MYKTVKPRYFPVVLSLAVVFFAVLTYLLFFASAGTFDGSYKRYLSVSVNLVPFATISEYISRLQRDTINVSTVIFNLVGNLLLFVPVGFALPYFMPKLRRIVVFSAVSLSLIAVIEAIQLFTMTGSFDVDDIILHFAGAMIGFATWAVLKRFILKPSDAQL